MRRHASPRKARSPAGAAGPTRLTRETTLVLRLDWRARVCLTRSGSRPRGRSSTRVDTAPVDQGESSELHATPHRRGQSRHRPAGRASPAAAARARAPPPTPTSSDTSASGDAPGGPANGQFGSITDPVCGPAPERSRLDRQPPSTSAPPPGRTCQGVTADHHPRRHHLRRRLLRVPGAQPGAVRRQRRVRRRGATRWAASTATRSRSTSSTPSSSSTRRSSPRPAGQDFALVGGGGVFDTTGQTDRLACLLPDFPGYVVSARGAGLGPARCRPPTAAPTPR